MAILLKLFEKYEETILQNCADCRILSHRLSDFSNFPILVDYIKNEGNEFVFKFNNETLRLRAEKDLNLDKNDELNDPIKERYFFWIEDAWRNSSNIERVRLRYIRCGRIENRFDAEVDIAFGDEITAKMQEQNKLDFNKVGERLKSELVFKGPRADYIFVEKFPNNEKIFRIRGLNSYVDITDENDKWIIRRKVSKPFPRRYDDFLSYSVVKYAEINFKQESEARNTFEKLRFEDIKGTTLYSLWNKYNNIENQKAIDFKNEIGELHFTNANQRKNGITTIRLNPDQEQEEALLSVDLDQISFDIKDRKTEISETVFLDDSSAKGAETISIFKYDKNRKLATIKNNDYPIKQNASGVLTVNIRGNEIVGRRRKKAQEEFEEANSLLLMYLKQAMEGVINNDQYCKLRNHRALTEETRKFIKKQFGIENLTENQEKAVDIAINTPDIAVIQGPPGTGKSTVVAVICQRLMELAKKENCYSNKTILVSAFQNDTVEHTASKILTYGLPTIKLGKDVQGIRAEDGFVHNMQEAIDTSLQKLAPNTKVERLSRRFYNLKIALQSENKIEDIKKEIDELIPQIDLSEDLLSKWNSIFKNVNLSNDNKEEAIRALKGLRTDHAGYSDDGFIRIRKVLLAGIQFSDDERNFLENAPLENEEIKDDYLNKLRDLQDKYLSAIYSQVNSVSGGVDNYLSKWLDEAIFFYKNKEELSDDLDTFLTANLENLRDDLYGNSNYIRETIRQYGDSIAATNQFSGSKSVNEFKYDNVILEEAARSNPLDLLIPMTRAHERIILIGDQKQLPHLLEPDILQEATKGDIDQTKKYEESLFGILFNNLDQAKPQRRITLTEQFRMHPVIGNFISENYYDNQLSSDMVNPDKKLHGLSIPWAKDKVAVFCSVPKIAGEESKKSRSKERIPEAERIVELLDELKQDPAFENLSIGIISFYSKQVDRIKQIAYNHGYTDKNGEIALAYKATADGREKLRIGTVDSFQGKEFDIVILSTVRSNNIDRTDDNVLRVFGFLTLENRLNVAFSRAQKLLITVGDAEMFKDDFAASNVPGLYNFYNKLTLGKYGVRI